MSDLTTKRIIIVGGSGFIGSMLTEALLKDNYLVTVLDLVAPQGELAKHERLSFIQLNLVETNLDPQIVNGCYAIINLAGAAIGKRWNKEYKKIIYHSRILTTRSIVKAIEVAEMKPEVLINASAAGYYGDQKEQMLSEDCPAGKGFLAHVCVDWEAEALKAQEYGVRVALIRTAHVLGPGGLLSALKPLFTFGLGGYFGSGNQNMPWIHWKDIVDIYMFALTNSLKGPYNVGAGPTISQKKLFKKFARAIHAPFLWPVPHIAARLVLGEFADALTDSQNTISQKICDAGYQYYIGNIDIALRDLYT